MGILNSVLLGVSILSTVAFFAALGFTGAALKSEKVEEESSLNTEIDPVEQKKAA